MFIDIPKKGYYFNEFGLDKIREYYNGRYLGYWCCKTASGNWSDQPVDIFYQPNPKRELGHTNYFGLRKTESGMVIINGESAFSVPIYGVLTSHTLEEVIVSRYRHDFVQIGDHFVDGGRDYFRCSSHSQVIKVDVVDGVFELTKVNIP